MSSTIEQPPVARTKKTRRDLAIAFGLLLLVTTAATVWHRYLDWPSILLNAASPILGPMYTLLKILITSGAIAWH
jgi:hypothetical protein